MTATGIAILKTNLPIVSFVPIVSVVLGQFAIACLGNPDPRDGGEQECGAGDRERRAETARLRHRSNGVGRRGARDAAEVVAEAGGGRANRGRIQLSDERAKAAE